MRVCFLMCVARKSPTHDVMAVSALRRVCVCSHMLLLQQVDDLKEGKGAEYVDVSVITLVLCSSGYFSSNFAMPQCPSTHAFAFAHS